MSQTFDDLLNLYCNIPLSTASSIHNKRYIHTKYIYSGLSRIFNDLIKDFCNTRIAKLVYVCLKLWKTVSDLPLSNHKLEESDAFNSLPKQSKSYGNLTIDDLMKNSNDKKKIKYLKSLEYIIKNINNLSISNDINNSKRIKIEDAIVMMLYLCNKLYYCTNESNFICKGDSLPNLNLVNKVVTIIHKKHCIYYDEENAQDKMLLLKAFSTDYILKYDVNTKKYYIHNNKTNAVIKGEVF